MAKNIFLKPFPGRHFPDLLEDDHLPKKALAKLLRHASTQIPPKDYGIKTHIQHTAAIIFIPFPFGPSLMPLMAGR